ncbi:pilus assembly protein [Salinarimonas soli]|nr:pilus assembly protein [Salinarimonas soli]
MLKRFKKDDRGATAVIFSIALLPILGAAGAALDYSRVSNAQADLQKALDGAALALVRDAPRLSAAELGARGDTIVRNLFRPKTGGVIEGVTVTKTAETVRVTATGSVPTTIMAAMGFRSMGMAGQAQAAWSNRTIELALVLDNTGSMSRANKMPELKKAANALLDTLNAAGAGGDRVSVSVVPFDTQVRLDPATRNGAWLRPLKEADLASPCGRVNAKASLLPATGADPDKTARDAWTGYVTDRDRMTCDGKGAARTVDMNVKADAPDRLWAQTLYPMVRNEETPNLPAIQPLTTALGAGTPIRSTIASMQPRGCTNITLGAMWGLETLSRSEPFTQAAPFGTSNVEKIMILLTDGENTRDSFGASCNEEKGKEGDRAFDTRTISACNVVKSNGVTVYTIKVIEGSDDLLRRCATRVTDPKSVYRRADGVAELYYPVTRADQLTGVFQAIVNQILQTRLTH